MENLKHGKITEAIIGAYFQVYNTLGWGFLESVYQAAMELELKKRGVSFASKAQINVFYDNMKIGTFYADLLVEGAVIVELKACESLVEAHEAQVLNYLKATDIDVGLLLNFGRKSAWKRKIFETARRAPDIHTPDS